MSCFVQTTPLKLATADRAALRRSSFVCDSSAKLQSRTGLLRKPVVAVLNPSPSTQPGSSETDVTDINSIPTSHIQQPEGASIEETTTEATENGLGSEVDSEKTAVLDQLVSSSSTPAVQQPYRKGDEWYAIESPIAKADNGQPFSVSAIKASEGAGDAVLDVLQLDEAGRQVLDRGSYDSVVDVNVDDGGILEEDEDNNDLFTGVGMEALLESETLIENLRNELGIETATHVQLAAIPRVLERKDMVMQSYTGTGKTLAFLLPILEDMGLDHMLKTDKPSTTGSKKKDDGLMEIAFTRAVIVAPTRELAMQITSECERLLVGTRIKCMPLIGGANPARQVERLRRMTPHIVVGTPGRLAELAEYRDLRVKRVLTLVVDEVDSCVEADLGECVRKLLRIMPKNAQKVLVSATGDVDTVRAFAGELLHDPILLRVGGALRVPKNINHWFCVVPARLKIETVRKLMFTNPQPERVIIFVDDPRRVDLVGERLWQFRIAVGTLRGNAHKTERKEVLDAFRRGRVKVLVSTEVAARGLDVKETTHVINLDLPTDADHYVHRAGRCGRVGRPGTVISIVTGENAFVMKKMSKELNLDIKRMEPRGGVYAEPLRREERITPYEAKKKEHMAQMAVNNAKNDRNEVKKKPKKKVETKLKSQSIKPVMDVKKGIEKLAQALKEDNEDYIKDTLGFVEDEEDADGGRSRGHKKSGKKEKVRSGAAKTGQKKKEKKSHAAPGYDANDDDDDLLIEVGDNASETEVADKKAKRVAAVREMRAKRDVVKRAVMEGWVGNRAKQGRDDSAK